MLESTRAKENAVKEETAEQLDAFRKQRALAEQSFLALDDEDSGKPGDPGPVGTHAWSIKKKKRRRDQNQSTESRSPGTKLRKLSSTAAEEEPPFESIRGGADAAHSKDDLVEQKESAAATASTKEPSPALRQQNPAPVSTGLGLDGYSSDEDD